MSVAYAGHHWLLPTCGQLCRPRRHDPHRHEAMGLLLALRAARATESATVVRTGPLVVDLVAERAFVHGRPVSLSEREWGVLAYYARHAGRPVAHEDVVAAVWGPYWITGQAKLRPGRNTTWRCDLQVLSVNVSRLRAKLGEAGHLIDVSERGKRRLLLVEVTP